MGISYGMFCGMGLFGEPAMLRVDYQTFSQYANFSKIKVAVTVQHSDREIMSALTPIEHCHLHSFHRKNYLYTRYLIMCKAVPLKQPSLYIYDTSDTHLAVAHPHMHLDPYKQYYMNGTARISVHLHVYYIFIPLKPANSWVGNPSHSTTSSLYIYYFPYIAS